MNPSDLNESDRRVRDFLGPRYWPVWAGIALLAVLRALPFSVQLALGRVLGRLIHRLVPKAQRTARINLRTCFPSFSEADIERVTREHFESLGMQLFETSYCWGKRLDALRPLARFDGLEHLDAARQAGRGVILVTGHFASLEIAGVLLGVNYARIQAMYRPQKRNELIDYYIYKGRSRVVTLFEKVEVRRMIASLAGNEMVVYLADQAYRRRRSAVLPFFGHPAMTNTSISHIARLSGAKVVPFLPLRTADSHYLLRFLPALMDFPSGDANADTLRINHILEDHIREDPGQYLWTHRRFKGLPPEYPDIYAGAEG